MKKFWGAKNFETRPLVPDENRDAVHTVDLGEVVGTAIIGSVEDTSSVSTLLEDEGKTGSWVAIFTGPEVRQRLRLSANVPIDIGQRIRFTEDGTAYTITGYQRDVDNQSIEVQVK